MTVIQIFTVLSISRVAGFERLDPVEHLTIVLVEGTDPGLVLVMVKPRESAANIS